MTIKVL